MVQSILHLLAKTKQKTILSFKIYGGSSEGISESNIGEKFWSWSHSINEENARSIGVPDDGIIYLPDLIKFIDKDLANTLDEYITTCASEAYNDLIAKYGTKEQKGTVRNPYKISTAKQLYQGLSSSKEGTYYQLVNDIDLSEYTWSLVDSFNGILDGNGYVISGLSVDSFGKLNDSSLFTGFIQVNNGTIKNLIFDNTTIKVEYLYSSSSKRILSGGIVGCNKGTISNVQVKNSLFDLTNAEKNDASGHDDDTRVYLGAITGWNEGSVEYCKVMNSTLKAFSDGKNNWGYFYSIAGGLVGVNYDNVSNCISTKVNINSHARGGWYALFRGGGHVFSYAGYLVGENQKTLANCISYNQEETSITGKAETVAGDMEKVQYIGLACGNNSGTFDKVYVIATDSLSQYLGNNKSAYKDGIKTNVDEIASITNLWANWSYHDGEFYITK